MQKEIKGKIDEQLKSMFELKKRLTSKDLEINALRQQVDTLEDERCDLT